LEEIINKVIEKDADTKKYPENMKDAIEKIFVNFSPISDKIKRLLLQVIRVSSEKLTTSSIVFFDDGKQINLKNIPRWLSGEKTIDNTSNY
jgi:predicted phosphatase